MHGVYELKDMLCKELEEYGTKSEVSPGMLEIVDKLAHAIKNLDKIIDKYEEEDGSYAYDDGRYMSRGSYTRGGRRGNAMRDSRGRYSRDGYSRAGDMADKLREMMHEAPDEKTRNEIQRLAEKMEQM